MRRRDFIKVTVGSVAAWPLAARAQQPTQLTIGVLQPRSRADAATVLEAFRRGLRETGFVEGKNLAIEYRFAEDQLAQLPVLAADLIERRVAVIVAGARGGEVAKALTTTVPIVFLSAGRSGEDRPSCESQSPGRQPHRCYSSLARHGGQTARPATRFDSSSYLYRCPR